MSVEAVLFDMIGTTVQEKDSKTIMNCLKLAFEEHGVVPEEEVIKANRGKDKIEMINIILQNGNHSTSLATSIFESFKQNINRSLDNFEPADNVEEVFLSLRNMGIQIGLGSGLPQDQFEAILNHLKWKKDDFQYIGISSVLGGTRPNPIMILDMMRSLNITDKSKVLKVGDTVADIEEGKNAGVKTVAIMSGTQSRDKLADASPDFLANQVTDVIEIVKPG